MTKNVLLFAAVLGALSLAACNASVTPSEDNEYGSGATVSSDEGMMDNSGSMMSDSGTTVDMSGSVMIDSSAMMMNTSSAASL